MLFHRSVEWLSSSAWRVRLGTALGNPSRSIYIDRARVHPRALSAGQVTRQRWNDVPSFPGSPATSDLWRPTMRISRPVIALALPVVVAAGCSSYDTPSTAQAPGGSGAVEPGAAGTAPDTTGTGDAATTGQPDPGMQGGINEGMNIDGPLSGAAGTGTGAGG